MYHSAQRWINRLLVVHSSWSEVSNSQFGHYPQSRITLRTACFPPPVHKFLHRGRTELFRTNISNTQCSSHTRKSTALSSFPDQLTCMPLPTWKRIIIWWVKLRGSAEGDRHTQCESSFNHSQLEKTGKALSLEKVRWQACTGPTQHCRTARNVFWLSCFMGI